MLTINLEDTPLYKWEMERAIKKEELLQKKLKKEE
jgi:hypothetical protein